LPTVEDAVECPTSVKLFWPRAKHSLTDDVDVHAINREHQRGTKMSAKQHKQKTLEDLFHETLKDMYYAEKQILKALPKMAKAAHSDELREAFEHHRDQTEAHVERLEDVFDQLGKPARGKPCEAILGIVEEGKEVMDTFGDSPALDAGLLAGAQAVEHYEISRYGTLKTWAGELGLDAATRLLDQTLQEEKQTDALLTKLAASAVNQQAAA